MARPGHRSGWLRVLVLLSGLAVTAHASTPVFRNRQILLPIFVAAGAPPEERAGAAELARVLHTMSGLAWPVGTEENSRRNGFYVGWTHETARHGPPLKAATNLLIRKEGEMGPDGFRIRSLDGSVFIEGATPEAAGFAVAWLLQHEAGVRWYAPGTTGEVIPRRTEWSLAELNLRREPAYVSREIYGRDTGEGTDWARHNGLRSRLEFNHALGRVFSPEIIATHPEWAPLISGRRIAPESVEDQTWQPNLALPEVASYAAQAAGAALARDPERPSFSLAMNDSVRFDQGAATRALVEPLRYFRGRPDYSSLVFTFMNRAAESLARTHPDRYLGCLAYFWCENPPPFRVNPQVVPFVTTDRTQYFCREYRAADLALMSRWGASGVRAFGLWEYGEGANFLVPRVPLTALADAVREGWQRGARGYFAEVEPQWGFDTFKVWMLAQLLWDPARPLGELANDFYAGYYGAAAEPMRRFFELCEVRWMEQDGPPGWLKFYQQEDQALLFPSQTCRELRALLDRAAETAVSNKVIAARVEQTSRAFAVTEAYVEFDAERRKLLAMAGNDATGVAGGEAAVAGAIQRLVHTRRQLNKAFKGASEGEAPTMTPVDLLLFTRNDPVPRLLWLAGQIDPSAPRRILSAAGTEAMDWVPWRVLAEALADNRVKAGSNLIANSSFERSAKEGQEPRFLFPRSGVVPADWELRAMPTETGSVALIDADEAVPRRALRVEGAWDTELFQWLPAEPGRAYMATAQLRGQSSPGGDSALYLKFRTVAGEPAGIFCMQSLPKGLTSGWHAAALADRAPADAAWVGIGVVATRQVPGDWLEISAMELRGIKLEKMP